jgi:DNA-directed RNA polymerase subunit RPC12/RpoP
MRNIKAIAKKVALRFIAEVPPDFQGNPKVHGIKEPRGGGFSIMQNLQEDLVEEEKKEREKEAGDKYAMYWCSPGRVYRLTKGEQDGEDVFCPRCKGMMNDEKFTRSERLLACPDCGFKIPTSKVVKKRIETEPEVEVDVEVTEASFGRNSRRTKNGL